MRERVRQARRDHEGGLPYVKGPRGRILALISARWSAPAFLALLGEAGAVAGAAVWLSFLACLDRCRAARLHGRQARRALPVVGGI